MELVLSSSRFIVVAEESNMTPIEKTALIWTLILLVVLHSISVPWWLFVPIQIGLSWLIFTYLIERASFKQRMLLDVYVRPESSVRKVLASPSVSIQVVLAGVAFVLAFITYVSTYAASYLELLVTCGMIAGAECLRQIWEPMLRCHLVDTFRESYARTIFSGSAVLLILLGLALTTLFESLRVDYSNATALSIANETIESVKHNTKFVRHFIRTVRYFELELLRIRDAMGWPFGWAVFLFFLLPNAIPAAGAVAIYGAAKLLVKQWE
jgi:hypothetical protein